MQCDWKSDEIFLVPSKRKKKKKEKKREEKLQGLSFKSRSMSRTDEDEWRMNEVVAPTKEYSPRIDWLWPSVCAATRSFASRATRNGLWDCSPTLCSAVHRRCSERSPSLRYVDYSTSFSRPFPPSVRISRTGSSRGLRSAPASETRPLPEIYVFMADHCGESLVLRLFFLNFSKFHEIFIDSRSIDLSSFNLISLTFSLLKSYIYRSSQVGPYTRKAYLYVYRYECRKYTPFMFFLTATL